MGNNHSQPTSNVQPPSAFRPRSLKHHKSSPHSLRLFPARESSSSISRSSSPSFNSFSEKYYEKEKENHHPSRTRGPPVRLSPPTTATSVHSLSEPVHAHIILPSPAAGLLSAPSSRGFTSQSDSAYSRFLHDYPQYASSWHIDALRRSEYSRLAPNETYVDYMGGALYPASLISVHAEFLQNAVLGNTHSESARYAYNPSSQVVTPYLQYLQLEAVCRTDSHSEGSRTFVL
jgi:molybdenum cofactor sulfurtransferase